MKKDLGFKISLGISGFLFLASVLLICIGGAIGAIPSSLATEQAYGPIAAISLYFAGFAFDFTSFWSIMSFAWFLVVIVLFAISLAIFIRRKKYDFIFVSVGLLLTLLFLPYLIVLLGQLASAGKASDTSIWLLIFALDTDIISVYALFLAIILKDKPVEVTEAKEETIAESNSDTPSETPIETKEEAVNEETKLEETKEPIQEETSFETKEEPTIEEKEVSDTPSEGITASSDTKSDLFATLKNRHTANFETRLKNSEFDLRHKYYDLRDYIKSYGLHNRVSIPGDTFSAHRKKYVFLTIKGKHIKANFALNPSDYADSPLPVTRETSKKYEDLPLGFKIRSDLSYRRALRLVDDMLTKAGFTREDKPIKNTQDNLEK